MKTTKRGDDETTPPTPIPADQAWFWTPQWQAMEREADADTAAGRVMGVFNTAEEAIAALRNFTE